MSNLPATEFQREVSAGQRFEFGKNWRRFLNTLNEQRIARAEESLRSYLGVDDLRGRSFLDVGSGSGLFSLAARRLGASVRSLDYDPVAVECARELRRRYYPDDDAWIIERGSALDAPYLTSLGTFDVVYSWGVLHHTGAMWQALENVSALVVPGGSLFISIYNDQGRTSRRWWRYKRAYNRLPRGVRFALLLPVALRNWGPSTVRDLARGRPFASWRAYSQRRGMTPWTDVVDWVGGFPFEVARPEQVFDFFRQRGYELRKLKTVGGGIGCNEFVFVRAASR
ncbi:MAG TPA: class I SAM-dependent methyltransferase [Ktedonobacterales bacterium]|nr:class I SAM-dependent methyltransferase [Ktedonobacterales bacterium]